MLRRTYTPSSVNLAHPLNRGLHSWWLALPTNEGSPQFFDLVGPRHGVLSGFSSGYGWSQKSHPGGSASLRFQQMTNKCQAPSVALLSTNNVTVSLWFYYDSSIATVGSTNILFASRSLTGFMGLITSSATGNPLTFSWSAANLGSATGLTFVSGRWYMAAASLTPSAVTLYLCDSTNGSVSSATISGSYGAASVSASTSGWGIMTDPGGNPALPGNVDDVRLYPSRSLTAAEVVQLFRLSQRGNIGLLSRAKRTFASSGSVNEGLANLVVSSTQTASGRLLADGKNNSAVSFNETSAGRLVAEGKENLTVSVAEVVSGRLSADGKSKPLLNTFLTPQGEGGSSGSSTVVGKTSPKRIFSPRPFISSDPAARGMLGWWLVTGQEYATKKWHDLVQGQTATVAGSTTPQPSWSPVAYPGGKGSVLLGGVHESVQLPSTLPTLSTYSVAFWFNWTGSSTNLVLFSQGSGGPSLVIANGSNLFDYNFSSTNHNFSTAATQNTWTHVVLTVSGGTATLYVNGVADATTVSSAPSLQLQYFGGDGSSVNNFVGNLDDLALWSRALSAAEVAARYRASRRGYPLQLNRPRHLVSATSGGSGTTQEGLANLVVSTTLTALGRVVREGKGNLTLGTNATFLGRLLANGKDTPTLSTSLNTVGRLLADGKNVPVVTTSLIDAGRLTAEGKSVDLLTFTLTGGGGGASFGGASLLVSTGLTAKGRLLADGKNSLSVVFSGTEIGRYIADGKSSDTVGFFLTPKGEGGGAGQIGKAVLTVATTLTTLGRLLAEGKSSDTASTSLTNLGRGVLGGLYSGGVNFFLTAVSEMENHHPTASMSLFLMATPPGVERASADLFIYGATPGSSGFFHGAPLYIDGTNAVPHTMPLFLAGSNVGVLQRHMLLFIKGIGLTHSAPLFLFNNQMASAHSAPLFIRGSGTVFGAPSIAHSMPLFLARGEGSAVPLFLRGPNSQLPSSGVPLYIDGFMSFASGIPLVIPNVLGIARPSVPLTTYGF